MQVTDAITDTDMRAVTSNAIFREFEDSVWGKQILKYGAVGFVAQGNDQLVTSGGVHNAIATSLGDRYTKAETDTHISNAINDLVDGAPLALDTLKEIALSLGNDQNLAGLVVTNQARIDNLVDSVVHNQTHIVAANQRLHELEQWAYSWSRGLQFNFNVPSTN